ncbi:tyrosine-type recombinase/integrase [Weissella koreensis]|uniref:tyrosine-type recombinase/integrase n=1 Tax=Weissella koreensis TaxID=165096 RepID=UPI0022BA147A|nr:tyrosine-type recombinase/integrase [Weissella koreensis]MCZ9310547.1 tyrosine-type recombinase/integrase [Weissella koreensis]
MSYTKQSDGTYQVRVRYTDSLGKRHEKKKKGIKSLTAAKKWERDTLNKIDNGEFDKFSSNMTLNSAFNTWLETYSQKVLPSTYRKAENFINVHILTPKWFDQIRVDKITSVMLQSYINDLSTLNVNYRKNLYPFKQVMSTLVSLEVIQKNPFDKVTFPKAKPAPVFMDRVDYYKKDQLKLFLDTAERLYSDKKYHVYALFRLLAFSGMRKGEALALEWKDINFDGCTIDINKALSVDKNGNTILSTPKTKAGNRIVKIDKITINILKHYQAIQARSILKSGLKAKGFVFTNNDLQSYMKIQKPRKWCETITKKADLPRIKIHGFRHTYATLSAQAGMNIKQLQYQLGHDDVQTTLAIYTAVTEEMKETTADIFTSLVNF